MLTQQPPLILHSSRGRCVPLLRGTQQSGAAAHCATFSCVLPRGACGVGGALGPFPLAACLSLLLTPFTVNPLRLTPFSAAIEVLILGPKFCPFQ